MNAKHTPGPWSRNIPPARKYAAIFAGRNHHVAYARWLADRAGIDLAGLDLLALRYGYRDVPTGGRMPDGTPCTRRKRYLRGVVFGRLYDTGTLEPARREPVVTIIIPRKGA